MDWKPTRIQSTHTTSTKKGSTVPSGTLYIRYVHSFYGARSRGNRRGIAASSSTWELVAYTFFMSSYNIIHIQSKEGTMDIHISLAELTG